MMQMQFQQLVFRVTNIIFCTLFTDSCFTSNIRERELQLKCQVASFNYPVVIRDPLDRIVASCDNNKTGPFCRTIFNTAKISLNYVNITVLVTIPNKQSTLEGKWTCEYGEHIAETNVSYSEGIISSTDVKMNGERINTNGVRKIILSCSTCQNPDGKIVEFLINNTTYDFVRFVSVSECYHKTGICRPQDCRCSVGGNNFTRLYEIPSNSSGEAIYTCAMHFTDVHRQLDFTIHSSLQFVNGDFRQLKTKKIVTRSKSDVFDISATRSSGTFPTTISLHSEDKITGVNWWFIAIGAGLSLLSSLIICGICACLKINRKSKAKNDRKLADQKARKTREDHESWKNLI